MRFQGENTFKWNIFHQMGLVDTKIDYFYD